MAPSDARMFYMRPMASEDVATIAHWFEQLDDLTLFESQSGLPVNSDKLRKDWERAVSGGCQENCYWFGVDDAKGRLVGIAGIEAISNLNGDCVMPIIIERQSRHRGLGTQIAAMIIDMVFDQLRLNRITTFYRSDNDVTRRLVTSLGFKHEGSMRQARYANGKYHDQVVVGLLASEWPRHRERIAMRLDGSVELGFGRPGQEVPIWPDRKS